MVLQRWRPRFGSLARWDPFTDILDIQQEMNRLFDSFFGRTSALSEGVWAPLVDIYETKEHVVVKAEIPGMKLDDIDITIVGDTLTLKGARKRETEVKEENYYRVERSYGAFQRAIPLPSVVDTNKVKATYKDGILEVKLSKKGEVKTKEIKIEVG
ncbi:MAG: Hsp20/alpha crystallin family protein [candidate division NC10 bacterium]|nr:Hsp20/alpha crystallin family protein [candidate division NC10 bacterium]